MDNCCFTYCCNCLCKNILYIYMLKLFIDIRVTHLEYNNDQR